jgi:hypothetical protein
MEKTMSISDKSLSLFIKFAKDASNWSGTPMVDITKEQRGNLTQLKKAGLVTTFRSDDWDYVQFTPLGIQLAAANGIKIEV